ncbi:hypothetical protein [Halostella sp. PRR32]|uniref:hypothetical protein n=1 Tax=Halostella sp. PRR32 TaxID=3098147 RepID=UPI002B1D4BB4|nr:hypothetical protein [Halostella sp. PRR32]
MTDAEFEALLSVHDATVRAAVDTADDADLNSSVEEKLEDDIGMVLRKENAETLTATLRFLDSVEHSLGELRLCHVVAERRDPLRLGAPPAPPVALVVGDGRPDGDGVGVLAAHVPQRLEDLPNLPMGYAVSGADGLVLDLDAI